MNKATNQNCSKCDSSHDTIHDVLRSVESRCISLRQDMAEYEQNDESVKDFYQFALRHLQRLERSSFEPRRLKLVASNPNVKKPRIPSESVQKSRAMMRIVK